MPYFLQSYQTFFIGSNIGELIKCVTLSVEVPQHSTKFRLRKLTWMRKQKQMIKLPMVSIVNSLHSS